MVSIFKYLPEEQAQAYGLVLTSTAIGYHLSKGWLGWTLWVAEEDVDDALDILELFIEENQDDTQPDTPSGTTVFSNFSGVWGALVLLVIHVVIYKDHNRDLFVQSLGAASGAILQGDLFRAATALMVHGSHLHLAGNLAGIALFGSAVCSVTGWGMGWLMILFAGICGNLINAFIKGAGYLSVGASTAVFGAIGIVATIQFINKIRAPDRSLRALLPLGGGLALLALLGSGAHTDIMAHLLGFLSGCAGGAFYGIWIKRPPSNSYQILFLVLTIGLLIGSWAAAPGSPG